MSASAWRSAAALASCAAVSLSCQPSRASICSCVTLSAVIVVSLQKVQSPVFSASGLSGRVVQIFFLFSSGRSAAVALSSAAFFCRVSSLLKAAERAKIQGHAIAIGHVGAEGGLSTAQAIIDSIKEIEEMGVEIVPLSKVIKKLNSNYVV